MGNLTSIWDTQNQTSPNVVPANKTSNLSIPASTSTVSSTSERASCSNSNTIINTTTDLDHVNTTNKSQWIELRDIPILEEFKSDPICINGRDFVIASIEDDDTHFPHKYAFIYLYLYDSFVDEWKKLENYRHNEPPKIRARGTKCVHSGDISNEVFADSTIESVSYIKRRRQFYVLTWDHIIQFILPQNLQSNNKKIRYSIESQGYNIKIPFKNPRCFALKNRLNIISSNFEYFCISDSTTIHYLKNETVEMHRFCAPIGCKSLVLCEWIQCVLMFCCDKSIYSYSKIKNKWSKLAICSPFDFSKSSFAVINEKRYILIMRRDCYDGAIYTFDIKRLQFGSINIKCPVQEGMNCSTISMGVTSFPNEIVMISRLVRKWSRKSNGRIPDVIIQCISKYCSLSCLHLMMNVDDKDETRCMHWKVSLSDLVYC